jgi:integrase/ribosomal protein L40E
MGHQLSSGVGVYNYPRRLELALQRLAKDRKVRTTDREKILKFKDECVAQGLSTPRVIRYVQMLSKLSAILGKGFQSATKEDIVRIVGKIEKSDYKDWTKQSYKIALKRFYKWLRDTDDYPPEVRWLRAPGRRTVNLLPEELLTEEDVGRLAEAADNPRDRALVQVLYETGCRAGEILSLKIKHMRLDNDGAVLIVTGKTGMRRVKIYWSQPALTEWVSNHPNREDPEAPLWLSIGTKSHNEQLTYEAFRATLRRLADRIMLKKHVNPHIFRHSRASWLASRIPEAAMKQYLGWMQDSKMAATYVHLSGRDVDAAMRKIQGLDEDETTEETKLKVRICPRCKEKNSPIGKFCSRCGSVMDITTALEIQENRAKADELLNILFQDPEVLQLLQRKIIEKNLT